MSATFSLRRSPLTTPSPAVPIQGSKNCFNHLIPVAFAGGPATRLTLSRTPEVSDRDVVRRLLGAVGVGTRLDGSELTVLSPPRSTVLPPELGSRLRVTICYAAALAANLGRAWCPMPGGDAFTVRPIDTHLRVLEAAGAHWSWHGDPPRLFIGFDRRPRPIRLSVRTPYGPSMGASVTALMVAAQACGVSTLTDLSVEPEVLELIALLRRLGVEVTFRDGDTVRVHGVDGPLSGQATAVVPPDRIEAGTYLLIGLLLHDRVRLNGIAPAALPGGFVEALDAVGVELTAADLPHASATTAVRRALRPAHVTTTPHPGFPTDLQPPMASFLTQVDGRSSITETIYRDRVSHVPELAKVGLDIVVRGRRQDIAGSQRPIGGEVGVTDIRCGAALIVAAAVTREPVSVFDPFRHLARGYGALRRKLSLLGMELRPLPGNAGAIL